MTPVRANQRQRKTRFPDEKKPVEVHFDPKPQYDSGECACSCCHKEECCCEHEREHGFGHSNPPHWMFDRGPAMVLNRLRTTMLSVAFGHPLFGRDECCEHREHEQGCVHHECEGHHHEECGCKERERECHDDVDIRFEAREGEVRETVLRIENNSPRPATITPVADPWTDAWGKQVGGSITFTPPVLTLEVCESQETMATVTVTGPLEAGQVYFTWIRLDGTRAKPISVSLHVEGIYKADHFLHADPWRSDCRTVMEVREEKKCVDECCEHRYPHPRWGLFPAPIFMPMIMAPLFRRPWEDLKCGRHKADRCYNR